MRILNEGGSFQLLLVYCWGCKKVTMGKKRDIFSEYKCNWEETKKSCIATQSPIKRHHEQLQLVTQRPEWWFGNAKMRKRNWGSRLLKLYLICCHLPTKPVKIFIEIWGSMGFQSLMQSEYFKEGLWYTYGPTVLFKAQRGKVPNENWGGRITPICGLWPIKRSTGVQERRFD